MTNKVSDLYELLERRWAELDSLEARQANQPSPSLVTRKMKKVGGRANKALLALLDVHHKAWGI